MGKQVLGFMALSFLSAASTLAQTARVGGHITDAQRASLPGVTVTMTHEATGFSKQVVTNAAGSYLIPSLDPGTYRLEASMPGFAPWLRQEIVLVVGQGITVDAVLELAGVTEA